MRLILSGYYGFNNAGDEAILAALIAGIKRRLTDPEIIVLSGSPARTEQVHGVQAIGRYDYKQLFLLLRCTDLLISGGGSLLQDATGKKTISYYLSVITLAKLFGVPVFFCAQGVGPINGRINRRLVKWGLSQVNRISVRDQPSVDLLTTLGVKPKVELTADPAFTLSAADNQEVAAVLKQEKLDLTPPVIGVAVRPWRENQFLTQLATVLDQLVIELQAQLVLIPFQYPEDKQISRRLVRLMEEKAVIIAGNYPPQTILGLVGEVDLLLGLRLHSLIFAVQQGVVPVGISYDPKVDNFLAQFGLHPAASTDNFQSDQVYRTAINLWKNKESVTDNWTKKLKTKEGLARRNLEIINRLVFCE